MRRLLFTETAGGGSAAQRLEASGGWARATDDGEFVVVELRRERCVLSSANPMLDSLEGDEGLLDAHVLCCKFGSVFGSGGFSGDLLGRAG